MANKDLLEKWLRRFVERQKKEAEEAKKKPKGKEEKPTPEIEIPEFKEAFFLEGEFGREINENVQKKYGNYEAINTVEYEDNIIKGSNPFYVVAVQEFLPQGIRVATQADLEKILKTKILKLEGQYEDSSLVWRSNQDPNKYLAKDIHEQLKLRGINLKEGKPYVIPLFTLKLREDSESEHKLAFDITDLTLQSYFEAPILNSKSGSYINPSEMNDATGLPNKVYDKQVSGNRQLWTRSSGICRLCLDRNLDAYSYYGDLADSNAYGRVVCVRAVGTTA